MNVLNFKNFKGIGKMLKLTKWLCAGLLVTTATVGLRAEDAKPPDVKPAPTELKMIDSPKADLPAPDADGFISMFNGKDLTYWQGLADYWEVKDGVISGHEEKAKSKQTFLVFCKNVADFEMHCKFKFAATTEGKPAEGNSGIQFRSKLMDPKTSRVGGYQADFDAGNGFTGIIYDEAGGAGGRGIMSNRGEKTTWDADNKRANEKLAESSDDIKKAIKAGDWNDVRLLVEDNHIQYWINGHMTTEVLDNSPKAVKEGVLALQLHAGFTMDIQFKDMKIKFLNEKK